MQKQSTASFSGYRPAKFPFELSDRSLRFHLLQNEIQRALIDALADGYTHFLCGMAEGFDLLCANVALDLRVSHGEYASFELHAVLPYPSQPSHPYWAQLHARALAQCDHTLTICPSYKPSCYAQRNRYLVQNASRLICYFDGQSGGTKQTVLLARKHGLDVVNLSNC